MPLPLAPENGPHRVPSAAADRPRDDRARDPHPPAQPGTRPAAQPGTGPAARRPGSPAPRPAPPLSPAVLGSALRRAAAGAHAQALRARLLTEAAGRSWAAGRPDRARAMLERALRLRAGDAARGRAMLLLGSLQAQTGVVTDAAESLAHAARLLHRCEPVTAREAACRATEAAWASGTVPPPTPASPGTGGADDYVLGVALAAEGRLEAALEPLRREVARGRAGRDPAGLMRAAVAAVILGEVAESRVLAAHALATARLLGMRLLEANGLELLAYAELRSGRHGAARTHAVEGLRAARRTGQRNMAAHLHAILAMAAAMDGDPETTARHAAATAGYAGPHGLRAADTLAAWALARCDLARGRWDEAAARLEPLIRPGPGQGHPALRMLATPCLIEAVVLSGRPRRTAQSALAVYSRWADVTADPQAPAQLARCRALLAGPEDSTRLFDRALAAHRRADSDFERSRTQLLHGMLLRRHRRPGAARAALRDALVGFERCGAQAWAERVRAELRVGGEAPGEGSPPGLSRLAGLTPQQLRIARHVAEGATNREVAARLAVSPRTVDHHLRNVFSTLGIRSRVELTRLLTTADAPH
ncbi:LuxR family transcriptional regulator [Streptomyces aidingensis]|uniref:Regulatory protein, luxR family n=1 Tax=Streptomyces aidingensis TaxID=910347 RepID=A0A1I1G087_9ACTN|nr:LuxR family transcriptional regulator [Streptomyces aidingensis]SFC02600.1 regulatory protein, luxR family [Streptomyces aidingensis]